MKLVRALCVVVLGGCQIGLPLGPWWCDACDPTDEERDEALLRHSEDEAEATELPEADSDQRDGT